MSNPALEVISEPNDCKGIYPALNFALKTYSNDYKYLKYIIGYKSAIRIKFFILKIRN